MKNSLGICIVNWNAGHFLEPCLASIENCLKNGFILERVVVVDNASKDGSLEKLEQKSFEFSLSIIKNSENLGFAKACNIGAAALKSEYILFLNPDTVLSKKALDIPLTFLHHPNNTHVGILGIQLLDKNGNVLKTCSNFPNTLNLFNASIGLNRINSKIFPAPLMKNWAHSSSREVDQVIGAFFIVRNALFKQLGGFDERFFVYYEEVDFSYRAYLKGYKSYYLSEAQAFHKGGGCSERVLAKRLFYNLRSKIQYVRKHFPLFRGCFILLVIFFLEPISRILYSLLRFKGYEAINTLRAYGLFFYEK